MPFSLSQVNHPRATHRIPLHMLNWQRSGRAQARWISSSARYAAEEKTPAGGSGDTAKPEDQPRTGLVSFGFQSLAGLVQPVTRPYQRPESDTRGTQDLKAIPVPVRESGASSNAPKPEKPFGLPTSPVGITQPATEAASTTKPSADEIPSRATRETIRSARVRTYAPVKDPSDDAKGMVSQRRTSWARRIYDERLGMGRISPSSRRVPISPQAPRRPQFTRAPAWGIKRREADRVFDEEDTDSAVTSNGADKSISSTEDRTQASSQAEDASSWRSNSRLTHVKSTGEAHMVDVGAKLDTRRSAIAISTVTFTNPQAFQLIFENSNKKGDVLGVARIAGIMAAKRTSDLIPLCHPISISKAELELKLMAPNVESTLYGQNQHGVVTIQAHIETTGPTGVEMEALTAASAAALTIYDMCKAVDRAMAIGRTRVVYKHGGHSGIFAHAPWMRKFGERYLSSRGLKVPDMERWVGR